MKVYGSAVLRAVSFIIITPSNWS